MCEDEIVSDTVIVIFSILELLYSWKFANIILFNLHIIITLVLQRRKFTSSYTVKRRAEIWTYGYLTPQSTLTTEVYSLPSNQAAAAKGTCRITHWKRAWCWERLKAGGEGHDRRWDVQMASPIQWTWAWAKSRPCINSTAITMRLFLKLLPGKSWWTAWNKNLC